jgi:hypothetical protein
MKMNRYLLFAYEEFQIFGGWNDFINSFTTIEAAIEHLKTLRMDEWHIVDTNEWKIVTDSEEEDGSEPQPNN